MFRSIQNPCAGGRLAFQIGQPWGPRLRATDLTEMNPAKLEVVLAAEPVEASAASARYVLASLTVEELRMEICGQHGRVLTPRWQQVSSEQEAQNRGQATVPESSTAPN